MNTSSLGDSPEEKSDYPHERRVTRVLTHAVEQMLQRATTVSYTGISPLPYAGGAMVVVPGGGASESSSRKPSPW